MKKYIIIGFTLLLFSCKKNPEFQSCTNYDLLIGEWKSIGTDTKWTIIFEKEGKITRKFGLERTVKNYSFTCTSSLNSKNQNYFRFFSSKQGENGPDGSFLSCWLYEGLDTLKVYPVGATDLGSSEGPENYSIVKYIKVK